MRVADYVAEFFALQGIEEVFLVSGGGMMFLLDGLATQKKINVICTHHEQAASMAAVAHAKLKGMPSVVYVTTGCGSTNAITGLLDAWQDSVPVVFVSGQSKRKESIRGSGIPLRQFGVQEVDIIPVVQSLTKYSVFVDAPENIGACLAMAWQQALSGRPGPVWLDIPLDVQAALIQTSSISAPNLPSVDEHRPSICDMSYIKQQIENAKRPIFIVGQGVRISGAESLLQQVMEQYNIPVVTTRLGIDVLATNHPLYIGRIGNKGDRAGNFALQKADFILAVGSRLSVSSTGHEYRDFGRYAKLAVVDIDALEHSKNTVTIYRFIHSDAACFLTAMLSLPAGRDFAGWVGQCQSWRNLFSLFRPEFNHPQKKVNAYRFMEVINGLLPEKSIVVSDAGSSFYVVSQTLLVKQGQRYITSGGQADMGFGLPAAVGASVAAGRGEVIGIIGDGSFQMNIQELQTVVHYKLPVKLFVWNNNGYLSIRATQNKYFNGRLLGADQSSGVSFPSLKRIASAYRIPYVKIARTADLEPMIQKTLCMSGPVLCEVCCLADQEVVSISSVRQADGTMISKPMEDMVPLWDRKQFADEMNINLQDEGK